MLKPIFGLYFFDLFLRLLQLHFGASHLFLCLTFFLLRNTLFSPAQINLVMPEANNFPPLIVEPYLSSIGLYRQKAKNIVQLAQILLERHHGEVPQTMEELTALPGVGRKTASVVLAACFNIPAIAVDTHVHRLANRLGVVHTATAEQTERRLLTMVPAVLQGELNRVGVPFGREICQPRTPVCSSCPLQDICTYYASSHPRR
jgi:endonuclease III